MRLIITLLFTSILFQKLFGQDTISTERFNSKDTKLSGRYVVLGLQSSSTIISSNDTSKVYPRTYYRVGELNKGKQVGIWNSYKIGAGADTLFWSGVYQNDTLFQATGFYPNGNPKAFHKYIDTRLVTSQSFLPSGKIYVERIFMNSQDEYRDFDAIEIGYYGNGNLKYIGKLKCTAGQCLYYGNWFYYSDKGELYKTELYFQDKQPEIIQYKIKGRYYEWYEESEVKTAPQSHH